MDNVDCAGTETTIFDCIFGVDVSYNPATYDEASIQCFPGMILAVSVALIYATKYVAL